MSYWNELSYGVYRTKAGRNMLRRRRRYFKYKAWGVDELRNGKWLDKKNVSFKSLFFKIRLNSMVRLGDTYNRLISKVK